MDGLDRALKNMRDLSTKVQRSSIRKATRRGAVVIRDAARATARGFDDPDTPETIWKNITIRQGRAPKGDAKMRVGVMGGARDMSKHGEVKGSGKGNPGGDTFYWRFLEFGTEKMPAKPFMRPAAQSSSPEVYATVARELEREVTAEAAKMKVR